MNFQAVLFDMDGVLWLTNAAHSEAYRRVLNCAIPIDEWAGRSTVDVVAAYLPIEVSKKRIAQLARRKQELARTILKRDNPVAPDALALLEKLALSCSKIGVVSSASRRSMELFLEQNPLIVKTLQIAVDGTMVELNKPAPDAYYHAARVLNVSIVLCLAVEDSVKGVQAAVRAGATVCGILGTTTSEKLFEAGAHFVVPSLTALGKCLGL